MVVWAMVVTALVCGCARPKPESSLTAVDPMERAGDEIVVCGQLFRTGTPVVLWTDEGGYNAYAGERPRFAAREGSEGADWTLESLRNKVDQFVIHYDAAGTSENCFRILHERRGLSVHFLLDIDGTIYQTLDLKERAWHATKANDRSIGIEIANIGAYPVKEAGTLDRWYAPQEFRRQITLPVAWGDGGVRTPDFIGRPARAQRIVGQVQGQWLEMYDLTNEQYEALIRLTAALCTVFPEIACDYPRAPDGSVATHVLGDDAFDAYKGVLGHLHVQENKVDPGPAFDWDRVIQSARPLVGERRAGFSTRRARSIPGD